MTEWTREAIDELLIRSDRAVERAMLCLYARQTPDEQCDQATRHLNGRGFNAYSARSGTYYAQWVQTGRALTGKHLDRARKIALKHSRQLVEEANNKAQCAMEGV